MASPRVKKDRGPERNRGQTNSRVALRELSQETSEPQAETNVTVKLLYHSEGSSP